MNENFFGKNERWGKGWKVGSTAVVVVVVVGCVGLLVVVGGCLMVFVSLVVSLVLL